MNTNKKPNWRAKSTCAAVVPLRSCRKLRGQLDQVKLSLLQKFGSKAAGEERFLRLALNEAEALAWQTPYPHLFFPVLAEEKAASMKQWSARQRLVKEASPIVAFAA
jgi:hypothetical protein